jgi:hypothetical protein
LIGGSCVVGSATPLHCPGSPGGRVLGRSRLDLIVRERAARLVDGHQIRIGNVSRFGALIALFKPAPMLVELSRGSARLELELLVQILS